MWQLCNPYNIPLSPFILWIAWFSWGTNFRGFRGVPDPRIPVPTNWRFTVWIMKTNSMATNVEPHECVIFVRSTKIDTHKNEAIHSIWNCSTLLLDHSNMYQFRKSSCDGMDKQLPLVLPHIFCLFGTWLRFICLRYWSLIWLCCAFHHIPIIS